MRESRLHKKKWLQFFAKRRTIGEQVLNSLSEHAKYRKPYKKMLDTLTSKDLQHTINSKRKQFQERFECSYFDLEQALLRRRKTIQEGLLARKEKLKCTEENFTKRSRIIIEDFRETKEKMRERMEEIVEKENIFTIPNLLCCTRIVCSPYLGYLIVTENYNYALTFTIVAGISDWVDGWVARNYKSQSTKIGSFLDPMADKILIGTLFLSLTYVNLIPLPLTLLIVGRDISLVAAGFVIRYKSLPPPRTLSRYFDATHATAQLAPTFISKINTGIQLLFVGTTLAAPVIGYTNHSALHILCYITAFSTIISAGSYLVSTNTYRYLRKKD